MPAAQYARLPQTTTTPTTHHQPQPAPRWSLLRHRFSTRLLAVCLLTILLIAGGRWVLVSSDELGGRRWDGKLGKIYSDSRQALSNWATNALSQKKQPNNSVPSEAARQRTRGRKFLVRDWSIWLGWNNVRYTIETGLLLAKLLDRELVLPAYTFATASITNRTFYPDPEDGETKLAPHVPSQQWKGWILPIESMLDIEHIKSTWKHSIRFDEYIKLTANEPYHSIGMGSGQWSKKYNHGLGYRMIPNSVFTNFSRTMVDHLPKPVEPLIHFDTDSQSNDNIPPQVIEKCKATIDKLEKQIPQKKRRRSVGTRNEYPDWDDNLLSGDQMLGELSQKDFPFLERCIASKGFRTLYGFGMSGWWMKAPYGPAKYVKRLRNMVGIYDELYAIEEPILHIEGELHNGFPPGQMLWSTLEGREIFKTLVRDSIKPPEIYDIVAARLELRMRARCGGRSWRASHMRRGDFLAYEWTAKDISKQWNRIESHIQESVSLLNNEAHLLKPAHEAFSTSLEPPKLEDPFYLATNTRLKEEVDFIKTKNVVLLFDLLEDQDKVELGFNSNFMDTLAILEQCLMIRSGFFYGDAHSSVDGLILNRRVHFGIDEKLTKIEYLKLPGDGQ